MADLTPYITLLAILVVWIAFIAYVKKNKLWAKHGVGTYGPFIMWRTQSGLRLIDRLAKPKRFWHAYAGVSKAVCLFVGGFILALLIWEATIVSRIPADRAPSPELMLGIPGINPVIPVVYGIIGLVVAIVIHEIAHGILTRVGGLTLRSLGVLLMVVPMGAFAEPDDQEIVKTDRRRRANIYAVGSSTNIFMALICAGLFTSVFMASVVPIRDNPVVIGIGNNSPANVAGLPTDSQLVSVDGTSIVTLDDFSRLAATNPGVNQTVVYYYKGQNLTLGVASGLALVDVSQGLAADTAGMKPGMILASINGTVVLNQTVLADALSKTRPSQIVNATVLQYDTVTKAYHSATLTVTLGNRTAYLLQVSPNLVNSTTKDIGFLGVDTAYMGLLVTTPDRLVTHLASPYAGVTDFGGFIQSTLLFIALPFQGFAPVESPLSDLFVATGPLGALPSGAFWFIANCLYWIFWINLMLGMTNVLPAVPLDGGYLFKDAIDAIVSKVKKNATEHDRQRIVSTVTIMLALFVFFLIIWQLIGPRLI